MNQLRHPAFGDDLHVTALMQQIRVHRRQCTRLSQIGRAQHPFAPHTEGRMTKLVHHFNGHHGADPKQVILGTLALLRKIPLMSGEPGAIRVHLKNPRERGDEALEEYLGPNLVMNAEHNMIEFDRDLLETPLQPVRDSAWKTTLALKSTSDAADALLQQIADQELSKLVTVSRKIGLSARTLQRRLEHCGIDFDALRDETRRSEAMQLIASARYSATEIAYMVGFHILRSSPSYGPGSFVVPEPRPQQRPTLSATSREIKIGRVSCRERV